jgi:hypothetical protein
MTPDPRVENRRIWLSIGAGAGSTVKLRISPRAPASGGGAMAALLSRGQMTGSDDIELVIPTGQSADGLSAYQLARQQGYGGTEAQWLASLVGGDGKDAYQIARELGYGGTRTQWLATLVGAAGASAFEIAKAAGFTGTQAQWLASLKGKDASAFLGAITVSQTALAAIAAGPRRVPVTIPASMGVVAGDSLIFCPSVAHAAYATHDVVAVTATSLSIGVTGPLLAIGAAMPAITGKLFRQTT